MNATGGRAADIETGSIMIEKTISVITAGDLCMWPPVDSMIGTGEEASIFAEIRPLFDSADVRLVNLENPLTDTGAPIPKSGPNLRAPEAAVSLLTAAGIDCAILANNHIGDYGPEGVLRTLTVLRESGIGYVGAGGNRCEARAPWIVERNGKTLAVLANGENAFGCAKDGKPGGNGFDLRQMCLDIASARERADYVLVITHAGNEYNPVPAPIVVDWYRTYVDAGADAVIGMHPHCPQGYEIYRNRPIVYSTGNFLFCNKAISDPHALWYYGYMPMIVFGGETPEMTIYPYRFTPEGCIWPLAGEERERMTAYLERISAVVADKKALRNHFDGWCAMEGHKILHGLNHKPVVPTGPDGSTGPLTDLPSLVMRILLTCEAHNDIAKNYIEILCDGRLDECRQYIPRVRALQEKFY